MEERRRSIWIPCLVHIVFLYTERLRSFEDFLWNRTFVVSKNANSENVQTSFNLLKKLLEFFELHGRRQVLLPQGCRLFSQWFYGWTFFPTKQSFQASFSASVTQRYRNGFFSSRTNLFQKKRERLPTS